LVEPHCQLVAARLTLHLLSCAGLNFYLPFFEVKGILIDFIDRPIINLIILFASLEMAKPYLLFEGLDNLDEVVGHGVMHNFAVHCYKFTLKEGFAEGVIDYDEEAVRGHVWNLHELLLARLHAHRNVVLVTLVLEMGYVGSFEVVGDNIGGMCGRNELLALHAAGRLSLPLFQGFACFFLSE
jgi:hypothetical protein